MEFSKIRQRDISKQFKINVIDIMFFMIVQWKEMNNISSEMFSQHMILVVIDLVKSHSLVIEITIIQR